MKLFFVMLFLCSSVTFATEVGEKMKAECERIISIERSTDIDNDTQDQDAGSENSQANGQ